MNTDMSMVKTAVMTMRMMMQRKVIEVKRNLKRPWEKWD
jgi:hypothetical protein